MKLITIFLLLGILPGTIKWETDFDTAKKTAREQHRLILLNFSGSDWCGPCILTRRDYLENPGFTEMADQKLVLVNADFPRKKKNIPSADQVKRNEALAEIYNKEGSFPLTLLLDAGGKIIKTWHGKPESSPEQWTAEIKSLCDNQK